MVANYTSPANLFHALRRQVKAEWRKPLVIMTPKGYLRVFNSSVDELVNGSYQEVIDDATVDASSVKRIVFCTGKVHSELSKTRSDVGAGQVAIVRLEQIHPFHSERFGKYFRNTAMPRTSYGAKRNRRTWVPGDSCDRSSKSF